MQILQSQLEIYLIISKQTGQPIYLIFYLFLYFASVSDCRILLTVLFRPFLYYFQYCIHVDHLSSFFLLTFISGQFHLPLVHGRNQRDNRCNQQIEHWMWRAPTSILRAAYGYTRTCNPQLPKIPIRFVAVGAPKS